MSSFQDKKGNTPRASSSRLHPICPESWQSPAARRSSTRTWSLARSDARRANIVTSWPLAAVWLGQTGRDGRLVVMVHQPVTDVAEAACDCRVVGCHQISASSRSWHDADLRVFACVRRRVGDRRVGGIRGSDQRASNASARCVPEPVIRPGDPVRVDVELVPPSARSAPTLVFGASPAIWLVHTTTGNPPAGSSRSQDLARRGCSPAVRSPTAPTRAGSATDVVTPRCNTSRRRTGDGVLLS
jgi:hypothetical protein